MQPLISVALISAANRYVMLPHKTLKFKIDLHSMFPCILWLTSTTFWFGFFITETVTKTRTRSYREVEEESSEMSRAFGHPLLDNARHSSIFCRGLSSKQSKAFVQSSRELNLQIISLVYSLFTRLPNYNRLLFTSDWFQPVFFKNCAVMNGVVQHWIAMNPLLIAVTRHWMNQLCDV